MNLWFEGTFAVMVAAAGVALGCLFSRLRKPYWMFGYFIPLALVLIYAVAIHLPALSFVPPISWMMMGRKKFAVLGFVATMVLTTPLSRVPRKRDRIVISILMAVIVFAGSVWPFIVPAFERNEIARLQTHIDANGVCIQTTDFTCGPASAVTALRKLGLPGEEGKIGILSGTSSVVGTPPDMLAEALQNEYGKYGLIAEYRPFKDISELKQAGLTLAVIKYAFMVDHYVTVLEVTDTEVIIGDPLDGLGQNVLCRLSERMAFRGCRAQTVLKCASPSACAARRRLALWAARRLSGFFDHEHFDGFTAGHQFQTGLSKFIG